LIVLPFKCQEIAKYKVKMTLSYMSASGFAVPYRFSISLNCGFAFGHSAETCFHMVFTYTSET